MADRWTDEREPLDWRDRQARAQRYRQEAASSYGSRDYDSRNYGSRDDGDRSFQPRSGYGQDDRARGPVFGERQSGADYTGPRYGAGGYYGYTGEDRGGRFYGDDGREPIYREEYNAGGSPYGQSERSRYGRPPPHDDGHAYRVAYGGRHPDHEGYYDSRGADGDRSFWERATDRVASWFGEDYDPDDRSSHYRASPRQADHRGRGPSGYKRSDDRIDDEVHERLTADPWIDASAISVSVADGEVTLAGTVSEREAKHRAERIVEDLAGVTHVQNNLRVQKGNFLTEPGRGFGDSASAAQMNADEGAKGRTN